MTNENSKGLTPIFSLLDLVSSPEDCKEDVTLPSDMSDWTVFSLEIEIYSNLWIKDWTSRDSESGSVLGEMVVAWATLDHGFGDLECDLEVGGDFEGVWLFEWPFNLIVDLLTIHSLKALLLETKILTAWKSRP